MGRKTLLFLSTAHCQACSWKNGELSLVKYFSGNAEGLEQFTEFLQSHCETAYLLADLIEEDFRHETVPHLRGSERSALIRRKLEQYYRDTPFRQATTLQRRNDGRRDDDMLFSALTNPALISPWLNIMLAHNIALAGIYSIPNISVPLVDDTPSGNLLLLSWEKHAGLRQTYFNARLLRFSRLTPVNASDSFAASAATEAARTQQYLKNLSLLSPGSVLDVHIICHSSDRHKLDSHLSDNAEMHYAYLDIQKLGRRIGSKTVYADSDATPLFLHLLAAQPPRSHYAAAEHTHFLRLSQLRHTLLWLSAAFATASLLWTSASIRQYMELEKGSRSLRTQGRQLSQQTRQIIQSFPSTLASATDMKTAVLLSRKLNDTAPPPQIILDGLAHTLDDFPGIRIDKLSWQASSAETGMASAQVIMLNGELAEFSGDYRNALNYLGRFRQTLIQRGYSVTAPTLPLDVSPQGGIAADTVDGNIKPAQFSLNISWRPAT